MNFVVGVILILLSIFGIATTRDLVRILVSLELATVGGFAIVASLGQAAFYAVLILTLISVSEASILAALIYRNYMLTKRSEVEALAGGREP